VRFKQCQKANGLPVSFKPSVLSHREVKSNFAAMAKWRVTQIVRKGYRFD
jgi:hypothetical protein